MLITFIYRIIVAYVIIFTVWNLYTEKEMKLQANAALVIIPLVLRLLMIK